MYFIRYYRIPLYGDFVLYLYQHCLTFSVTSQPCQEKRFLPGKWELVFQCSSSLHLSYGYAAAKSRQSCLTLCDSIDGSPPGSPVPGILQARTLEWVAISFCNAWKWKNKVKSLSRARLLATPWTAGHQAPLPMRFSRQEYWSGVPSPSLIILATG